VIARAATALVATVTIPKLDVARRADGSFGPEPSLGNRGDLDTYVFSARGVEYPEFVRGLFSFLLPVPYRSLMVDSRLPHGLSDAWMLYTGLEVPPAVQSRRTWSRVAVT